MGLCGSVFPSLNQLVCSGIDATMSLLLQISAVLHSSDLGRFLRELLSTKQTPRGEKGHTHTLTHMCDIHTQTHTPPHTPTPTHTHTHTHTHTRVIYTCVIYTHTHTYSCTCVINKQDNTLLNVKLQYNTGVSEQACDNFFASRQATMRRRIQVQIRKLFAHWSLIGVSVLYG